MFGFSKRSKITYLLPSKDEKAREMVVRTGRPWALYCSFRSILIFTVVLVACCLLVTSLACSLTLNFGAAHSSETSMKLLPGYATSHTLQRPSNHEDQELEDACTKEGAMEGNCWASQDRTWVVELLQKKYLRHCIEQTVNLLTSLFSEIYHKSAEDIAVTELLVTHAPSLSWGTKSLHSYLLLNRNLRR
jgi:hypothetical protein